MLLKFFFTFRTDKIQNRNTLSLLSPATIVLPQFYHCFRSGYQCHILLFQVWLPLSTCHCFRYGYHCTMCLSTQLELSKVFKSKGLGLGAQYLLNFDPILKIPLPAGQKLSKDSGENIPIKYLLKMWYWLAKNLLRVSAKLEILHTSKLMCAEKKHLKMIFWQGHSPL